MILKKIITVLILAVWMPGVFAQVELSDQPGNTYYDLLKKSCIGKMPSQTELLAAKSTAVTTNFIDTLKKYDWVEIGGYMYHDKTYFNYFDPPLFANEISSQYQFNIFRIENDGTKIDFSLKRFQMQDAKLTTTSFAKGNCSVYQSIKISGSNSFIQSSTFGELAFIKIVSFSKGVLIVDINKTGKIADTKTAFRNVYVAVEKKFKFTLN